MLYEVITETFSSFSLLDSAALIYSRVPGYQSSWETGVIYNNKSSALLMKALYDSTITGAEKNTLLELSVRYCDSSITLYKTWLGEWGELPEEVVAQRLLPGMNEDDPAFAGLNFT